MLEKPSGGTEKPMTLVERIRSDFLVIAGPKRGGENQKAWLARAARTIGISCRSARAIFYSEITDPRSSLAERIWAAREGLNRQTARLSHFVSTRPHDDPLVRELESIHTQLQDVLSRLAAREG